MCRLFAITSDTPVSPMVAIEAMDVMREGHDGSGVGLFLRDSFRNPCRQARSTLWAFCRTGIWAEVRCPRRYSRRRCIST